MSPSFRRRACSDSQTSLYSVSPDGKSISFYPCGIESFNSGDVENRYCALCHRFVEQELREDQREVLP